MIEPTSVYNKLTLNVSTSEDLFGSIIYFYIYNLLPVYQQYAHERVIYIVKTPQLEDDMLTRAVTHCFSEPEKEHNYTLSTKQTK